MNRDRNDHPGPSVPSDVRALTLRQPWASAIADLGKDVENRTWTTSWRGTLLIHAGQTTDRHADLPSQSLPSRIPTSVVVAVAELRDCHRARAGCCSSIWAEPDTVHWVLTDVIPLRPTLPATGAQGLWRPDPALTQAALATCTRHPFG